MSTPSALLIASLLASPGSFVTVHGHPLYVEQLGDGPPVVMLHGGTYDFHSSFEKQIDGFSAHHRVIGIEQVAQGHTPDAALPLSYDQMAEDTAAVLDSLHLREVTVVGWSDGGIVGLLLARRHPEHVKRLVISGANIRRLGMSAEQAQALREASAEKLVMRLGPAAKERYVAFSPDGAAHWPAVVRKLYDLWLTPVMLTDADLKGISAPVLVVSGDHDLVPLEQTEEIFRALPHARLLVLPGTGHATFREAAETLDPIVLGFIDSR